MILMVASLVSGEIILGSVDCCEKKETTFTRLDQFKHLLSVTIFSDRIALIDITKKGRGAAL